METEQFCQILPGISWLGQKNPRTARFQGFEEFQVRLALGELRSTMCGLQTVLLGFLRPQTIGITGFFKAVCYGHTCVTHTESEII